MTQRRTFAFLPGWLLLTAIAAFSTGCRVLCPPHHHIKEPVVNSTFNVPEADGQFTIRAVTPGGGPLKGCSVQVATVKGYAVAETSRHDFQAVVWSPKRREVKASIHHSVATPVSDEIEQPILAEGVAPVVMTHRTRIGTSRSTVAIEPLASVQRVYFIESHDPDSMADVTVFGGDANGADLTFKMGVGMFCEVAAGGVLPGPPQIKPISGNSAAAAFVANARQIAASAGVGGSN